MSAKPFSVRLPDEVRADLAYLSEVTHRSQSSIAIQLLAEEAKKKSDKLRAIEAAKEDIKSGVLHSGEQIIEWMDTWGSKNEKPSPKPDIIDIS
ncbi:MAG: Arc family DNA-binding protein [Magnetococcales bacterium]|nr:Arc family DNA-binding protein [Magnetococcales bacterium]